MAHRDDGAARRRLIRALRDHRNRLDLSQEAMGRRLGFGRQAIMRMEQGKAGPSEKYMAAWFKAFTDDQDYLSIKALHDILLEEAWEARSSEGTEHIEVDRIPASGRDEEISSEGVSPNIPDGTWSDPGRAIFLLESLTADAHPVDSEYVNSLRTSTQQLVALDNQFGGDELSVLARRILWVAKRRLASGISKPGVERDLQAVTGELAEVTAWMLYDANKQVAARRVNKEALSLSRLAGDRPMELLILQNMSMQASHTGRPVKALEIATEVLEQNHLPPRTNTLFKVREARALAQLGEGQEALRAFGKARAMFLDGPGPNDAPWTWWVKERELAWHEGMCYADLGMWAQAVDRFEQAVDGCSPHQVRTRFNDLGWLMNSLVEVHSWRRAEETLEETLPYVGEVASARTSVLLYDIVDRIYRAKSTPTLRDGARTLQQLLKATGYPEDAK